MLHVDTALPLLSFEFLFHCVVVTMSMELMAEAMGLGTLYVGLFSRAAKMNKRIRNELGLTKKENLITCLAIGYPDVKYMRTVPRKKADIEWR